MEIQSGGERRASRLRPAPVPSWRTAAAVLNEYAPVCLLALAIGLLLAWDSSAATKRGTDYFYYYCVSKMVLAGHGGQIYNPAALGEVERNFIRPLHVPGGVIPNNYPPFFALAFVALAALPYSVGFLVWTVLSSLFLGVALTVLGREAGFGRRGRLVFALAVILSLPVIIALLLGQVSMLLLAALTGLLLALRAKRDVLAGIFLALTLVKPQYVIAFLILLIVLRCWRALAAFLVSAGVLALAPLPVLGLSTDAQYIHALLDATRFGAHVGGFTPRWNDSLAGFAQLLLPATEARILGIALSLVALGLLVLILRRRLPLRLAFAVTVVIALLTSQHVLIHDLTLLVIPVAVILGMRKRSGLVVAGIAYIVVAVGWKLAGVVPLQLSTLLLCVIAAWLVWLAGSLDVIPRRDYGQPVPMLVKYARGEGKDRTAGLD